MGRPERVYLDPRVEKWENLPKFDPFTDANDDYAVLEWMRKNYGASLFGKHLKFCSWYQIGDYAKAALKVIAALDHSEEDK